MSAHGISPVWVMSSKFKFGEPWFFDPTVIISLYLNCDFKVDENDIGIDITTINLNCAFKVDEQDILKAITTLDLDCDFKIDEADILQPITTISLSCFTEIV